MQTKIVLPWRGFQQSGTLQFTAPASCKTTIFPPSSHTTTTTTQHTFSAKWTFSTNSEYTHILRITYLDTHTVNKPHVFVVIIPMLSRSQATIKRWKVLRVNLLAQPQKIYLYIFRGTQERRRSASLLMFRDVRKLVWL